MSRVVYKIERSIEGASGVRKIGMMVEAAPQDRLLDRWKPSYRLRHAALVLEVKAMLESELQAIRDTKLRRVAIIGGKGACQLRERIAKEEAQGVELTNKFVEMISKFRVSTLELIIAEGTDRVRLMAVADASESLIREMISYRHVLEGAEAYADNFLNDVRESAPRFALEDLSSLTGDARAHAERIVSLSKIMWQHARETVIANHHPYGATEDRIEYLNKKRFISAPLAVLVGERTDVLTGIGDYVRHSPLPVTESEVGHFLEYLNAPSRALAVGVL